MALASSDLVCSWWTIAGAGPGRGASRPLAERVAAAARAGFRGVGLRNDDYTTWRAEGRSEAELRSVLASNGIEVFEIEFVSGWSSDDAAVRESARRVEDELYAFADALGGLPNMNVGCSEPADSPCALEAVVERFAGLCDRAGGHGLTVSLEFMPWTGIPDAASAWDVVRLAGYPNSGVLVDTWHYFRGASDPAQLRAIPSERIVGLQINDAAAHVVGTLREDTLHRRLLPGEGAFDLASVIRVLDEMAVAVPYAIEVISDAQSALPLDEAVQRAFESTTAVLAKARSG